ncbi:MAG: metallopeptidase family protein [Acidobacteria bacterium]|nr:metallopeptidase family protein [Acidobacteriota bacterium]
MPEPFPFDTAPQITGQTTLDLKQIRANMKQMDSACRPAEEGKMEREKFVKLVEETLDALPARFRKRIHNVAVLVEDLPSEQLPCRGSRNAGIVDSDDAENVVLGVFEGVPATRKSVFDLPAGPDRVVLYQKNIEAACSNEDEIRKEIRLTVLHELGHYFGMTEAQPIPAVSSRRI